MRVPFRLIDVFAEAPLAGNQLCVVPGPVDLPTQTMQALALEIGFSETTFVTAAEGSRYSMRIFTPAAELPFAGHPTLGTAFALVSEGRVASPCVQSVPAGEVEVEVDLEKAFARMRQFSPRFGPLLQDRPSIASAVGVTPNDLHPDLIPQVVSTGTRYLILPVRDEAVVVGARPDALSLPTLLDSSRADGVYLFSVDADRAKARMFAAGIGIAEDPATGSAAGPLGAYLAEQGRISSGRLTISQGAELDRPSSLIVDVDRAGDSWEIFVGGGVFRVGEGSFELTL